VLTISIFRISAFETENFESPDEVCRYLKNLLDRLRTHAHRFILLPGCSAFIKTTWPVLKWCLDAWRQLGT